MEWTNIWYCGHNEDFFRTEELLWAISVPNKTKKHGSLKVKKSDNEQTDLHAYLFKRQSENRGCHKTDDVFFLYFFSFNLSIKNMGKPMTKEFENTLSVAFINPIFVLFCTSKIQKFPPAACFKKHLTSSFR